MDEAGQSPALSTLEPSRRACNEGARGGTRGFPALRPPGSTERVAAGAGLRAGGRHRDKETMDEAGQSPALSTLEPSRRACKEGARGGTRGSRALLALDHAQRRELRHLARETCALHDLDYALDVLVRKRRLLRETLVRRRAHDDALRLELPAEVRAGDLLSRTGPREPPAGAVARAPGDEHGLADPAIRLRDLVRPGGEGSGRALAMHEQRAAVIAFDLRHVVGDVVDLVSTLGALPAQHAGDGVAGGVGDRLAVRPGEVGGGGHRR